MPREEDRPVQQSVLDRLLAEDDVGYGASVSRAQSVRDLKAAVRRDLEWLLNTRAVAQPAREALTEVRASVYNYGLGDITSISADDPKGRAKLRQMIESAILTFEPRLMSPQVSEIASATRELRQIRFQIQAVLRLDPSPERISFDTVLDMATGQYAIRGDSGA
jgi:type VI secretion system protein ImpF